MGFRIVRPDVVVLPLPNGDTITVRRRLNTGEERKLLKRSHTAGEFDGLDYGFYTVVAHLIDWSSPDASAPVIRGVDEETLISTLNGSDPDDFIEVKKAIEAHRAAMVKERSDEKKTMVGTPDAGTSHLPSAAAGALSGSVN